MAWADAAASAHRGWQDQVTLSADGALAAGPRAYRDRIVPTDDFDSSAREPPESLYRPSVGQPAIQVDGSDCAERRLWLDTLGEARQRQPTGRKAEAVDS